MSVLTSRASECDHGVASTATAVGVGQGVPVDTDQSGTNVVPAQGGESLRPEGQDGQAKLAKILGEARAVRDRGGDVDALCRLQGQLQVLFGKVDAGDYWRVDEELRNLIGEASKPQGSAGAGNHTIAAVVATDPDPQGRRAQPNDQDETQADGPHAAVEARGRGDVTGKSGVGRTRMRRGLEDRAGTESDEDVARHESEPVPAPVTAHPAAADQAGTSVPATDAVQEFSGELEVHPTAEILPLMTDPEFEGLVASIAAHGQREPVVIYQDRIVDGRNRYRACRQLGIPVKVRHWDGLGSLVAFIVDRNLERRHLSESQRALLAVRLKEAFEEEARANMSRGGQGLADLPNLRSRDRAAESVKVSSRLVGSAAKVAKRGAPELVAAVGRDEVTVSAAAEVAALDRGEQAALVARGPAAVREKAGKLREARTRKKPPPSGDTSKRPEGTESGDRVKFGEETLLPAPGWLEQLPVRSRLADPAAFDFLATRWWIEQRLLDRFGLQVGEEERRTCARRASFEPDPIDLAIVTEPPDRWPACPICHGAGGDEDEVCFHCRGRGFTTVQLDATVRVGSR
jgi:ParB-like chromosome segregation protein Spo0J